MNDQSTQVRELTANEIAQISGGLSNPFAPGSGGVSPYVNCSSVVPPRGVNPSTWNDFRCYYRIN